MERSTKEGLAGNGVQVFQDLLFLLEGKLCKKDPGERKRILLMDQNLMHWTNLCIGVGPSYLYGFIHWLVSC